MQIINFLLFSSAETSCLNNSAGPTGAGLDEYVDILQVQQLLLDSTPATGANTGPTNNTTNTSKARPRVNLQKAAEYSSQAQGKSVIPGRDIEALMRCMKMEGRPGCLSINAITTERQGTVLRWEALQFHIFNMI